MRWVGWLMRWVGWVGSDIKHYAPTGNVGNLPTEREMVRLPARLRHTCNCSTQYCLKATHSNDFSCVERHCVEKVFTFLKGTPPGLCGVACVPPHTLALGGPLQI
jgi:hypothetical protein